MVIGADVRLTRLLSKPVSHTTSALLMLALCAAPAFAYRPFDGTDAAVANQGEMEIELQPAGVMRGADQKTLIAPAAVLNFGLTKEWEAILEGQLQTPLSPAGPT